MEFKKNTIKAGMIIYCRNKKELKELLEYLEKKKYKTIEDCLPTELLSKNIFEKAESAIGICKNKKIEFEMLCRCNVSFFDLIEPSSMEEYLNNFF